MNITIEIGDTKKINYFTPVNVAHAIETGEVILKEIKKILPHVEEVEFNTTSAQFLISGRKLKINKAWLYINYVKYSVQSLKPTWILAAKKPSIRIQKVGHDLNALLNEVLTELK
jgi:hypothetical protein